MRVAVQSFFCCELTNGNGSKAFARGVHAVGSCSQRHFRQRRGFARALCFFCCDCCCFSSQWILVFLLLSNGFYWMLEWILCIYLSMLLISFDTFGLSYWRSYTDCETLHRGLAAYCHARAKSMYNKRKQWFRVYTQPSMNDTVAC